MKENYITSGETCDTKSTVLRLCSNSRLKYSSNYSTTGSESSTNSTKFVPENIALYSNDNSRTKIISTNPKLKNNMRNDSSRIPNTKSYSKDYYSYLPTRKSQVILDLDNSSSTTRNRTKASQSSSTRTDFYKIWKPFRRTRNFPAFFLAAILVASLTSGAAYADWTVSCPAKCKCNYISNKKVAQCDETGYTTVPSTLSPEVQVLKLSKNRIRQIDKDEFQQAGLVNLQELDLANNEITYIDKDAFSGLMILIELNLRNNAISKLHPLTFTGMVKLRKLELSGNSLTRLEAHQFPALYHLQSLKLDNCKIRYVHNYAFVNLPNVTFLGLSSNNLENIQSELFSKNSRLVSLELSDNHWNCDCRMRAFARWMSQSSKFSKTDWNCFSPNRLKDYHWEDVPLQDFACEPTVTVAQNIVSVVVGSNSTLRCYASGDPMPTLQWVAEKRVLSNMTAIGDSTDHYVVNTVTTDSGLFSTLELGIYGDNHPTQFTCIATNPAKRVEQTIKVVVGDGDTLDVIDSGPNRYVLISIGIALIVLFILLIVLLICCWFRRKPNTAHKKQNGTAGDHGNVMVVAPSNSINPVGKPPRLYEKLPQKDIEMTHIINPAMEGTGGHKSFEDVNYPNNQSAFSIDHRSRLPPLEEEEGISGLHPSSPYVVHDSAPSPTLTLQSNITQTTTSHYPDLLDNARVPRTISPTQMSYQSLAYPPLSQDWRFSYAHPQDLNIGASSEYARSPVAYSTPQHQRPGYVTLPRRPRAPSWSGVPTPNPHIVANPLVSPTAPLRETIYDTLGPRTTADGTSTTDLTRPGSRAAMYEPFPPNGSGPPATHAPTSPLALAAHYNSVAAHKYNSPRYTNYHSQARPGTSQTLPRSAPNLSEDNSLSIPQYRRVRNVAADPSCNQLQPMQTSDVDPLMEESSLGIPFNPSYQFGPIHPQESASFINGDFDPVDNHQTNNNNSSKNNYNNSKSNGNVKAQLHNDTLNKNVKSCASPAASPSDFLNQTTTSSLSPDSPVPTPTQILSSASSHSDQQPGRSSPTATPNKNISNGYSETYPKGSPPIQLSPSSTSSSKKKVPPKPPPKPSSKRLSISSNTSDTGGVATGAVVPRKTTVASGSYQEDGPDGSEV